MRLSRKGEQNWNERLRVKEQHQQQVAMTLMWHSYRALHPLPCIQTLALHRQETEAFCVFATLQRENALYQGL